MKGSNTLELRERVLEGTLQVFNYKGMKFTMDDIARTLGISKKTIYTVFHDKKEMLVALVDYLFDAIKEEERKIYEDDSLSTVEKISQAGFPYTLLMYPIEVQKEIVAFFANDSHTE